MAEDSTWTAGCIRVQTETATTSLVSCPSRRAFRVDIPAADLTDWLKAMDGSHSREQLIDRAPYPTATAIRLWQTLVEEGCLAPDAAGDSTLSRLKPQALQPRRPERYLLTWSGPSSLAQQFAAACTHAGLHARVEADDSAAVLAGALDRHAHQQQRDQDGRRIVWCLVHQDRPAKDITDVDAELEAAGAMRLHVRVVGDRVFAGPVMAPSFGPTMADLFRRREAAAASSTAYELDHGQAPPAPVGPVVRPSEWSWASAYLVIQLERWLCGAARAEITSAELELDCVHLTVGHHGILAMPDQIDRRRPTRTRDTWHLRDPETGIVKDVSVSENPEHFPRRLRIATARGADMRRVMDMANDLTGFGTSWDDPTAAEGPAIGELLERYCANWMSPATPTRWGSHRTLRRQGLATVAPADLVGYSASQLAEPGFPFAALGEDTELTWVRGRGLVSGEDRWVPACWVYVSWNQIKPDAEARHLYPNLSGIAGGRTVEEATFNGLEETVERDASMVWWANRPLLTRLPVDGVAGDLVGEVVSRYDFALIEISRQFGLSTVAACARDRFEGYFSIGFATRGGATEAARKALAETFTLQRTCLTMDQAAPGSRAAQALTSLRNLKPHRADRKYLDSYRPDFRDVKDLACQLQIYLDPRAGQHVAPWTLQLPLTDGPPTPPGTPPANASDLARRIAAITAEEPIVVDLTTPDVAEAGFAAVRVLSPGLVPNFPAAFPQWGGGRVQQAVLTHAWWHKTPLAEECLNTFPLAHF